MNYFAPVTHAEHRDLGHVGPASSVYMAQTPVSRLQNRHFAPYRRTGAEAGQRRGTRACIRWDVDTSFRFSAGAEHIDRAKVHRWLSEQAYWALGRDRAKQDAAIEGSRNYGVWDADSGEQVAYARVVTDGATFAWLCDVFVAPEVRGAGVGKMLIAGLVADLEPLGLRRVLLATADAHGLYSQYGFAALPEPSQFMDRMA